MKVIKNMVDERFELAALIFRLAGHYEYNFTRNDYQNEVVETFEKFVNHEVVEYAKDLFGYSDVFLFSVCIEKKDDKFIFTEETIPFISWGEKKVKNFITLLNDFYVDINYVEFYNSHQSYFEEVTKKFVDDGYGAINFEWFGKYVDPSNLRCIFSPSIEPCNYAAVVNDTIFYCLVSGDGSALVHEYCHSFATPLAHKWYKQNPEFANWCDDSVNMEKMEFYGDGRTMAGEYVTRAYDILYKVQHGGILEEALAQERNHQFVNSFPHIEKVYNMILELEK